MELSAAALAQLRAFQAAVMRAGFNLTGWKGEAIWQHGVMESLTLAPLIPAAGRAVDVGSGAGFPGIPLAIARPGVEWVLLEGRRRRAAFLQEVVKALALANVTVVGERAEVWGRRPPPAGGREGFDWAVARALGAAAVTLELLLPLVRVGGRALVVRVGSDVGPPPAAVCQALGGRVGESGRLAGGVGYWWAVEKVAPAPARFPRQGKGLGRWPKNAG